MTDTESQLATLSALAEDMETRYPRETSVVEISLSPSDLRSILSLLEKVRIVEESSFSGVRIAGRTGIPAGTARLRMADDSIRTIDLCEGAA